MRNLIISVAILVGISIGFTLTTGCKKEEKKGPMEKLGEKMNSDAKKIKENVKKADSDVKKKIQGEN